MSSAATIAIVIAVIVVLAAVVLVTSARRADVRGAGALSRETVKRDKSADKVSVPAGASFESAEVLARSTALEKASEVAPVAWVAPDEEAIGVSRRQFFNRAAVTMMSASIGAFGVAVVAFLWPRAGGGFGSKVNVGRLDDLLVQIRNEKGFVYKPEARTWLTAFPTNALPKARAAYAGQPSILSGMEAGIVALYQKCPHLGCRVPECKRSQWFECPCHGSQYIRVGEKKAGPA
ncbi:MAG: ubiquinol-cytochrome c reductase iron-sulfur subunit, partial [Ilumatobacteraceae bacterium]